MTTINKTYTVFSLRNSKQEPIYFGITSLPVEIRLRDMMKGARCSTAPQYQQKVSVWLREQYNTFQSPGYRAEGLYTTKEEANAFKAELMRANIDLLNVKQTMVFKKV